MTIQPQQTSTRRARLLRPGSVAAIGAAAAIFLAILVWNFLAPAKTPPPSALETAAARALQSRYGSLYTLAQFIPGPAFDRPPPALAATSPVRPAGDNPASPFSPIVSAPAPDGRLHYNATLSARLSEALYVPVDAPAYIAHEMKLDTSAERKIEEIMRGPGGARIRELAGIDPNADSLASLRLIRETARAGARFEMLARIKAVRSASGWHVNIASLTPKTPLPEGETLDKFSGRLIDITRDSDRATLRRLVAQSDETLRRVETARERHRSELAANASRVIAASLARLTPGALYAGKATLPGQRVSPGVCLEIVSTDRAASTLRASLRAEISWIDARPLEGRYACDADTGIFTLTLSAREGIPLASAAGLVIADTKPFRLMLRLAADELSGDTGAWSCKLARIPDAGRAAMMAAFGAAEQKLLDATRPGLAYRVRSGDASDIILRFQTQDPATGSLTATIEDIPGLWKRELHGAIAASPARANGYHLRLLSVIDSAPPPAALSLRLEDGNVFKGSIRMHGTQNITVEPAGKRYLDEIAEARRAAAEEAVAISSPARPANPLERIPAAKGAFIWDETAWKALPSNNARVVRSTLQKVGGIWSAAVSLVRTRPEKQETGTLTFEGAGIPPSASGRNTLLVFRGAFTTNPGVPAGKFPIEVALLEIKANGRKRVAELNRLGDAAATFGKKAEPLAIERSEAEPDLYVIRVQRQLPAGRYALHAPGHSFEFEIK